MYKKALEDSATAAGTLNEQQAIYMDSVSARIQQLGTAAEGVYDSLLNADTINYFVDKLTVAVQWTEKLVDAFGGLKGVFATFAPIALNLFSTLMASNVTAFFDNLRVPGENIDQMKLALQQVQALKDTLTNEKFDFGKLGEANTVLEAQILKLTAGSAGLISPQQVNAVSASINAYSKSVEEAAEQQQIFDKTTYDLEVQLKQLGISFKKDLFNEDYKTNIEAVDKLIEKLLDRVSGIDPILSELSKRKDALIQEQDPQLDALIKKLEDLETRASLITNKGQQKTVIENGLNTLLVSLEGYREKLETATGAYQGFNNATGEAERNLERLNKTTESMNMTAAISGIAKTATSMSMLVNAGESVKQTFKDISNGTGSLTANITKLGFSIGTLMTLFTRIPQISSISHSIQSLKNNKNQLNELYDRRGTLLNKRQNIENSMYRDANRINMLWEDKRIEEANHTWNSIKDYDFKTNLITVGTNYQKNVKNLQSTNAELDKIERQTDHIKNNSDSMLKSIGSLVLLLAAMAAIMWAITATVQKLSSIWNENLKNLEQANKELSQYKSRYSEIKDNISIVDEKLSKLKSLEDVFKKLSKGTEEWNNQLKEIQNTIEELIEKFPALRKYAEWKDGGYIISSKNLEEFLKELENQKAQILIMTTYAQAGQYEASAEVKRQLLQTSGNIGEKTINFLSSWDIGKRLILDDLGFSQSVKDTLNEFTGVAGTLGQLQESRVDNIYVDSLKDAEEIEKNLAKARDENNTKEIQYWELILDYQEALKNAEEERLFAAKLAIDLLFGEDIKQYMTDKYGKGEEAEIASWAFLGLMALMQNNAINSLASAYKNIIEDWEKNGNDGILNEEIKQYFLKMFPEYDPSVLSINKTEEGNFAIKYGEEQLGVFTAETIAILAASQKVLEQIEQNGLEVYEKLDSWEFGRETKANSTVTAIETGWRNIEDFSLETLKEARDKATNLTNEETSEKITKGILQFEDLQNSVLGGEQIENYYKEFTAGLNYNDAKSIAERINTMLQSEGPETVEAFYNQFKDKKLKITDIFDFSLKELPAETIYTKFEEDFKALKIEPEKVDVELRREALRLGIDEDAIDLNDDLFVDSLIRSLKSKSLIEKILDAGQDFFDSVNLFKTIGNAAYLDKTAADNLAQLQEAISTAFGKEIDDLTIISNLALIQRYVNGVKGSGEELALTLNKLESKKLPEKTEKTFFYLKDQGEKTQTLSRGEVFDELKGEVSNWSDEIYSYHENEIDAIAEKYGYIKNNDGTFTITRKIIDDVEFIYQSVEGVEGPAFISANEINDDLAKALGYQDMQDMLDKGWLENENGDFYKQLTLEQSIAFKFNGDVKKASVNAAALGLKDELAVADYLLMSLEEFRNTYYLDSKVPGMRVYRLKTEIIEEIGKETETDMLDQIPPAKTDDNKEEVYTKKQEWKDVENKYDYNALLQKDVDREMQQLKDEMQYMTGPALAQAYDTEIGFLEEKNRLLQESIDLKKEELKKTNTRLDEIAAKYGVTLERDEKGRVTAESAQKAIDAMNVAGKSAQANVNAAQEALNNAGTDDKTKTLNNLTKAQENLSEKQSDLSEFTSGLSEGANYSADIDQSTYEIYKNTKEIIKLDVSKMWAEADDKIKQCKDDISAINTLISELNKDSAYLDFAGQMDNAATTKELREKIKGNIETEQTLLKNGINNMITSDESRFKGMDISAFDLGAIGSNDLMRLYDARTVAKSKLQELTDLYDASADKNRKQELYTEMELWLTIIDKTDQSIDLTSQYNDILRDTKVNLDKVKDATDQINIEAIDNQISKYLKDLDKLQDDASGLTGKKLIDNLNKQLAILKKIVAEEKKKLPEYKKLTAETEKMLTSREEWAKINAEIKYNEDGSLANYYEIVAAIESAIDLSREQRDKLLSQLEILQKISQEYAKQEETIRKAEKAAKDTAKKIKDEAEKELGKAFEKLNARVDVEVNIEDAWRQLHKLRAELEGLRDDDYLGNLNVQMKQLTEYLNTNPNSTLPGGSTQILTDHLNRIMSEINVMQAGGTSSLYGTDVKQAFSDLENYRNQVASNAEAVMSNIKEIKLTYLSAIDALISANDKYLSSLEKMNSVIKKVSDAIKLVYGDAAYDKIMGGIRAQLNNAVGMANASANQLAVIQLKIYSAPDEDSRRKWEDAFTNSVDKAIDYATLAIQAYDDALNTIIDKTQSNMLAFWEQPQNGQMPLSMQWDLELKDREDFYDYTNSLYETNTLRRKFQSEMSKVTAPAALEKLKNAQEEIVGYLDEQIKKNKQLTKYEVERANLLYELTLRLIALEEARDNKVKMRLRRDNAGNYRYEYVADETDIADKEQAVEETKNKLYNNAIDNAKDTVTSVRSAMTDMFDNIKELSKQPLTPEEYDKAVKNYKQIYDERIKKIIGASGLSVEDIIKYGAGGNENFLNLFKQLQEGGLNFTGKDLTEISDQYEETYEGKHGLEQWIEANADNYLNTLLDISNHDALIAIDIENQVNEMELQVQALQGIEEQLKSLVSNALSAYEQSLLYRNTDINADNATGNAEDNANGLSRVQPIYGAPDGAGGTVDYYYDPATGKYYYDSEFNNSAGSAYMEEKYGAERLNGRDTSNMSHRSVAYSSTYAERYANETAKERADRLLQEKEEEGEELTTLSNKGKNKPTYAKDQIEASASKPLKIFTDFKGIAASIAADITKKKQQYGSSAVLEAGIGGINQMLAAIGNSIENQDFNLNVTIDARFDGKTKENEILGAFQRLVNDASQFATGVTK